VGYHNEPLCPHPGVIIGRKGAYRGIHYSDTPFFVIDTAFYLTLKSDRVDIKWAYYQLLDFDINKLDSGSAIPSTSREAFYAIPVKFPPINEQRRIVSFLSGYDDQIENNTRRIKILEQMTQMLYREWFVNFRFPGHENVQMLGSEAGPFPRGWRVMMVADFGKVVTGKTPSTEKMEYFGGDVPFIKTPDMHGNVFCLQVSESLSLLGAKSQRNKTLPENSIIVNCIGALAGSVSITTRYCQTNQQINAVVLTDQSMREYLYLSLVGLRDALRQIGSNGATMINVNKSKFEGLQVKTPPETLIRQFHALSLPLFDCIKNLQLKNINLKQTRDLLLPKLVSGEVSVEQIEEEAFA
jgi:type I restriction enzyme S subunit